MRLLKDNRPVRVLMPPVATNDVRELEALRAEVAELRKLIEAKKRWEFAVDRDDSGKIKTIIATAK